MALALRQPELRRPADRRRHRAGGLCRHADAVRRGDAQRRRARPPRAAPRCSAGCSSRVPDPRRRAVPDAEPGHRTTTTSTGASTCVGDQRRDAAAVRIPGRTARAALPAAGDGDRRRARATSAQREGAGVPSDVRRAPGRGHRSRPPLGPCGAACGLPRSLQAWRSLHGAALAALVAEPQARRPRRRPWRTSSETQPSSTTAAHARQDFGPPTKAMATAARPGAGLLPRRRRCLHGDRRRPAQAGELTARSNLVAVITNGTAVLGLGNIGPLAGKPVMEGKGCLFKKFAGIDVFDIELAENDPDALIETIARMEPTFGGINLEDIKAPECFYIETQAARAHEDPGLPRRPARHGHRRGGGDPQRAEARRQGHRARSSSSPRARARRRSPASTWSVSLGLKPRQHRGHRRQGRGLQGPHRGHGRRTRRATPARPARARWPR